MPSILPPLGAGSEPQAEGTLCFLDLAGTGGHQLVVGELGRSLKEGEQAPQGPCLSPASRCRWLGVVLVGGGSLRRDV